MRQLIVACALVTRNLGVYYLVGAFVVGMVAQQYRQHVPSLFKLAPPAAVPGTDKP